MTEKLLKRLMSVMLAGLMLFMAACAFAEGGDLVWITPSEGTPAQEEAVEEEPEWVEEDPQWVEEEALEEFEEESAEAQQEESLPTLEEAPAASAEWVYPVPPQDLQSDYVQLANASNLLDEKYVPSDLVKIKAKKTSSTAIQMRQAASDALSKMFEDALAQGLTLYAHSGYRSYGTQRTMYNNRLQQNGGKDDGYVTKPGASDHQTGLGVDVISKAWIGEKFNSGFAQTPEAQWMAANCANYGFVIRYPEDKVDITGIAYEPWHLRYVGVAAAQYMTNQGLTLEEFSEEWPPVLAAFVDGGGVVNNIVVQTNMQGGGAPTILTLGVYRTEKRSDDGEYEYSFFASQP